MEIGFQTLAQRKAAKKSTVSASVERDSLPAVSEVVNHTVDSKPVLSVGETPVLVAPQPPTSTMTKEDIIKLAQLHGLKFEGQKKTFVKHTYSVVLESKDLFKKYCDTLGVNMQDAMEEALQDFFKKHALEYSRVRNVLNTGTPNKP